MNLHLIRVVNSTRNGYRLDWLAFDASGRTMEGRPRESRKALEARWKAAHGPVSGVVRHVAPRGPAEAAKTIEEHRKLLGRPEAR
jgi:hypothetical protein